FAPGNFRRKIGICDALRGTGFNLLIISVENRRPPEQLRLTLPATVQHGDIDGLILFQTIGTVGQTIITQLREEPGFAQRPIVSVLYPYDMIPAVLATEDAGAEDAAEHLLALGHRHLVHLVPMHAVSLAEARLHGVATALRRHGLDPALHLSLLYVNIPWMDAGTVMDPPEPVYTLPSQDSETSLAAFLDAHPEVTAFLGWNDACAIHLCRQLARAGIAVPERISVIGHDDTHAFPDDMGRNRLTSIRLPLRAIGERAGALLMDTLTGEAHDGVESFSFTTTLMVRQTTGPAPR
ncbi:MAG TPA: LacI family DNA-binding transcriptional regulator, partial [Armatimonadota bacterium]|nr:LacI family DNA-binding transcriptional regulator [Armatimonadota bacterium]